ncbi:plasmid stabilization protein, PilT domain protein (plasmid) [Dinoroseobacter shibae DFL 12 = DSM 16493]|jgi:predicted nucleic acid-binding protein|uniref:Ribonuclease VapC n=1 Tax=Dinoroseobacter shibae (strain DSM 16493 / NCIMB 14021 / DFL 12) TaxID=398580 RepID=A8LUK3_DINSH|nr:type II toxin-antitoxin system VapC family toxin [Dinoroseobacter shibae]ABV95920.1 plasmid stabilization protein, PilT domain protein [Dinoroseobacter shibae DFL 12 = DSM 16493]URF49162.1 type II toxin-antitoxin system VapC family toxin [Dinoroseobacter shibae]URF53470.1 type II toxin-antitoxin system VapC family toxin [Dinoroseobacter shibae]
MIILDTNVVSELMRPAPSEAVLAWFRDTPPEPLALTAVTVAELRYGIAALPEGRRKAGLAAAVTEMLTRDFPGLVLPFDQAAAEVYGAFAARHRGAGRSPGQADVMIAAIAGAHGAGVATRNLRDFEGLDLRLMDPFAAKPGAGQG